MQAGSFRSRWCDAIDRAHCNRADCNARGPGGCVLDDVVEPGPWLDEAMPVDPAILEAQRELEEEHRFERDRFAREELGDE